MNPEDEPTGLQIQNQKGDRLTLVDQLPPHFHPQVKGGDGGSLMGIWLATAYQETKGDSDDAS